jgi:hypothetical protein
MLLPKPLRLQPGAQQQERVRPALRQRGQARLLLRVLPEPALQPA